MVQQITFSLQTITPLFLAGADQRMAELRPSSFRGNMRYWYRALIGGMVGTDTVGLKKVTQQEAELFGATDVGSALRIRIAERPSLEPQAYQATLISGQDYLLWSMLRFKPAPRHCFPSQTTFSIGISALDDNDELFLRGLAAFWLLTFLGGVGSRSRRCAGSLQVLSMPEDATLAGLPFAVPATLDAFRQQLSDGLQVARKLCKYTTISVRTAPAFDVLSASACRIWLLLSDEGVPWQSKSAAMDTIGARLRDYYRTLTSPDQRKVFGLPVQNIDWTRLPSPLHLSLKKLQDEQYIGVAVLFKTDIPIGKNHDRADYTPIEDWIKKSFSGKSSCEVRL